MIKRTLKKWLECWGEWERYQRDYLKPLRYKSAMLSIDALAVKTEKSFLPELNDDEAKWVCDALAAVLRDHTPQFNLLKDYYVLNLSTTRMAHDAKTTRDYIRLQISAAEGVALVYLHDRVSHEIAA